MGLDLIPEGVYVETVGVACTPEGPVAMPVGLLRRGASLRFKLYRGTSLWRAIRGSPGPLVFYAPRDPLDFLKAVDHVLEGELAGCRPERGRYTLLVECDSAVEAGAGEGFDWYECRGARVEAGDPAPYTRAYGCIVELLVVLTKAWAGAVGCDALEYARWLGWCVGRSAPGLAGVASSLVERVREALKARCRGVG